MQNVLKELSVKFNVEFTQVKDRDTFMQKLQNGKKFRGSLELKNTAVYRVDAGNRDNSVLGIYLYEYDKYFLTNKL